MSDLVIYHADCPDGFTAAWCHPDRAHATFHAAQHGKPVPFESITADTRVFIVDFAYSPSTLDAIAARAESVVLLDHHDTAIRELAGYRNAKVQLVLDKSRSGAGIAWDYWHEGKPRPVLVTLVEDRDLWRFAHPGTRQLMAWVCTHDYTFATWDGVAASLEDPEQYSAAWTSGATVLRAQAQNIRRMARSALQHWVIAGREVPAINLPYYDASEAGHYLLDAFPDAPFAVVYFDRPDGRVLSLRSPEGGADVAAIARKYGGGGHVHAAGFRMSAGWRGDKAA